MKHECHGNSAVEVSNTESRRGSNTDSSDHEALLPPARGNPWWGSSVQEPTASDNAIDAKESDCGVGMDPPTYLKPGDVATLGIKRFGEPRPTVVADPSMAGPESARLGSDFECYGERRDDDQHVHQAQRQG